MNTFLACDLQMITTFFSGPALANQKTIFKRIKAIFFQWVYKNRTKLWNFEAMSLWRDVKSELKMIQFSKKLQSGNVFTILAM